jgi:membrane peptidoglycan carboxypeptidase
MQSMMQRVITSPHGTAHRLHLAGYTFAGKTGTAQIFDFGHHVYTHRYNASFLGFAPLNNPSIVIVATVSGTTGIAGFGSAAAGPAVQTVAEAALRLRDVPRDVPEEIEELEQKELAAKEKLNAKKRPKEIDDGDAVAVLSTPLTEDEMKQAAGENGGGDDTVEIDGPKVPDFVGETVRTVMQEAAAKGIDVDMLGDGMARAQYPLPGRPMLPGEHVRVRFAR